MTVIFYYIYLLPLALGFLSGLSTLRLGWPRPFKYFCIFLLATLSVELFALSWKYFLHKTPWWDNTENNLWIYNLYLIPQYLFYIYFFSSMIIIPWMKRAGWYLAAFYIFTAVWGLSYLHGLHVVNYVTIITANFIVIFFSVSYFVQLMKATDVIRLARHPMVWVSIGAFIFHLGSLPCFILLNYISYGNMPLALSLFRIIILLNTVMYLLYSTAFICTRKFPMSPSSP